MPSPLAPKSPPSHGPRCPHGCERKREGGGGGKPVAGGGESPSGGSCWGEDWMGEEIGGDGKTESFRNVIFLFVMVKLVSRSK